MKEKKEKPKSKRLGYFIPKGGGQGTHGRVALLTRCLVTLCGSRPRMPTVPEEDVAGKREVIGAVMSQAPGMVSVGASHRGPGFPAHARPGGGSSYRPHSTGWENAVRRGRGVGSRASLSLSFPRFLKTGKMQTV